jgi:profilin
MSWQDYVNGFLMNFVDKDADNREYLNVCEHGAIVGNGDGTVWAKSDNFSFGVFKVETEKEDGSGTEQIDVDEFANLKDSFENEGVTKRKGGLRINKEKYFMVNFDADKQTMYLKKNGGGACVAKSNLAYIIGTFNTSLKATVGGHGGSGGKTAPQAPGNTNFVCEKLQTFLKDNNL